MKLLTSAVLLSAIASAQAITFTQWNFDASNLVPNIGIGSASLVGGATGTFATGLPGQAWNTSTYPAASAAPKSAGVQFLTSSVGYMSLQVSWDERHSNTSANTTVLQYTINGGSNWVDFQTFSFVPAATGTGDTWHVRSADLSSVAGVNNNANFGVRVVTDFNPGGTAYLASRSTSTYGTSGTLRFDNVTIGGTVVPEPSALAGLGVSALILMARRRR